MTAEAIIAEDEQAGRASAAAEGAGTTPDDEAALLAARQENTRFCFCCSLPECRTPTFATCQNFNSKNQKKASLSDPILPICHTPILPILRIYIRQFIYISEMCVFAQAAARWPFYGEAAQPYPWGGEAPRNETPWRLNVWQVIFVFFSHSTHSSHMSEPILPISHL